VLLKDTALSYVIAYPELLQSVKQLSNFFGNRYFFSFFLVVLAIYLVLNLLLSWIARIVAKRTGPGAGRPRIPRRGVHAEGAVSLGAGVISDPGGGPRPDARPGRRVTEE
jgi:glutamate transport system permease protein